MTAFFLGLALATAARAETILDLQKAVQSAQAAVDQQAKAADHAKDETLKAVGALGAKGNTAAMATMLAMAEQREQAAAIAALQSTAALRKARQALSEALLDITEQGSASERAAARAEHGEVAPSVSDLLVCDGPDCVAVSAREHAAMVLMGAVTPVFDHAKWPPADAASAITVLAYRPEAPPLATLKREVTAATERAQTTRSAVNAARGALQSSADRATAERYVQARTAADAAQLEHSAAEDRLTKAVRRYADAARALKRASLLAGDGYTLKTGAAKACRMTECIAAEGLEAAAFLVIGAAEDAKGSQKRLVAFVAAEPDGRMVFR